MRNKEVVQSAIIRKAFNELPEFIPRTDEERIRDCYVEMSRRLDKNDRSIVCEKIDGESSTYALYKAPVKNSNFPMLIIISDTDHRNTGRDHFWELDQKIKEAGFNTKSIAKCFKPGLYLENSTQHSSSSNKYLIPENIKEAYNCAIECSSAQLIIEVR